MENDDAVMAGEDDGARAEEFGLDLQDIGESAEDCCEVEHEGQAYRIPAALKGAFLRHADYTRKTQELAEHRRELEAERHAFAARRRTAHSALLDEAHLAALEEQLAGFEAVDWQALSGADPDQAQALWAGFEETRALRDRYANLVDHHAERGRLEAAREAAEQMAETGRVLRQEIEGWSPEMAAQLVDYAQAFGVTLDELREVADPRLWKLLHRAWQADEAGEREAAARSLAQAQTVRPAVTVAGAAAGPGGVRDDLATKEWMRRRNEQMRKGR